MKSTGVVRKTDTLGRVVIPIELRRTLDIKEEDSLEIYVEGDRIILKKYAPGCLFCGQANHVIHLNGKNVCKACIGILADRKCYEKQQGVEGWQETRS